jgi:hypothetical protein
MKKKTSEIWEGKEAQEDWANKYPWNTFFGETKSELMNALDKIIKTQREQAEQIGFEKAFKLNDTTVEYIEKQREQAYLEGLDANYARTYKSSQSYLKGYEDGAKSGEGLGFIRQYLGEQGIYKTYTGTELLRIFNTFAPLMTPEQEKEIIEELKKHFKS